MHSARGREQGELPSCTRTNAYVKSRRSSGIICLKTAKDIDSLRVCDQLRQPVKQILQ